MAESKLEQKPEASQTQAGKETTKVSLAELLAQQKALQQGRLAANVNGIEAALEEQGAAIAQNQQSQSNATTVAGWAAVLATVMSQSNLEKEHDQRRALKAIQEQMYELLAKEKEREKAKFRESSFFKPLVGILGHSAVESITQKLETAAAAPSGVLQNSQAARTQVANDIVAIFQRGASESKFTLSGDQVGKVLERELAQAVALLPSTRPALQVVRPEDSVAIKTHEIMRSLTNGEERLLEVQKLRSSLGPEKFAAMVDAYDKKFGMPLAVHIATISTSSPTTQAEMLHEVRSVLSPAQQQRCTEFGRAEFAQVMAVLDKGRETAERQTKVVQAQMREAEKHLSATLGRPELKDVPVPEMRAKLVSEIVARFPGLKGQSFEDIALRLKEVAGEKDEAAALKLLQGLMGGAKVADPGAMLELATRTTLHMQKLLVLDQQLEVTKNTMSKTETGDEAMLRKHYAAVFGLDATTNSAQFAQLKSAAGSYMHHLEQRLADPSLSSESREKLIRERDTIDFGYTKKLVAEALGRETPDPQRAVGLLSAFYGAHAGTEFRRGAQALETAKNLTEAIQNADALRREWQGLTPEQFAQVQLQRQTGSEMVSCISVRATKAPELDLAKRFSELHVGGNGKTLLASIGNDNQPVSRKGQFDVLAAQREAAQSTKWFSQILETGMPLEKGEAPILKVAGTKDSIAMETRLARLDAARNGMDSANVRARSMLGTFESEPVATFLRSENLSALEAPLKSEVAKKLGAASAVDAVAKVSRELDPKRELLVDKEVLANLRGVADPKSEIGKAILATSALPNDPQSEFQAIKSRLSLEDGVRLDTFVAVEEHLLASGSKSDAGGIWKVITEAPIDLLSGKLKESLNEARISRVERLLGALTDEEHQEFLAFFELTTRQSVGQVLIQNVPAGDSRSETLLRLAQSRNLTTADVQRLLSEPVPADRKARAEALARALDNDTKRTPIDSKLIEDVSRQYGYEYATLRAAANVAAEQGRSDLVSEIAEKMRAHESRVSGTITRVTSVADAGYIARQGVRESLKSASDQVYDTHSSRVYSGTSIIATTSREVAALLRPEQPKSDAAFNRIRQANLSEEESLYLRALYAKEANSISLGEGFRALTGNLAKDLEPLGTVLEAEKTRIGLLMKGGYDALLQADLRTLDRASIEHHEKLQLETLINLRATGQYEQARAEIEKKTLAPAAADYHKAVSSGDKVKADTVDVTVKAKNGSLKPEEVATFVKDKKSEDFARINKENPQLMQQIQASNPTFFDTGAAKLLSEKEAERKKAVEQIMLKSLTDPMLFNEWLNTAQTKEAKVELIRNLEALIEKQPTAPKFVANNEPKLVQFVRAQKTDFREIDAHLINTIIVSTLSTGQALKPEIVERLRTLRAEASAQLSTIDVFHEARNAILTGAKDVEKALESYKVWVTGSAELRKIEIGSFEWITDSEGKRKKEEARAKILADIRERHPELKGRTDAQIEQGEFGTRWHWRSGYILDKPIAVTGNRLDAQRQLLAPMEGGVNDIRQSRELIRAGFALMAKDAVAEVYRGLSPDATENVMTLLRQRDQKITYKVTDEKAQKEWSSIVEEAQKELDAKDRWTNIGLAVGKVGTCLVASVVFPPSVGVWAGLGVATLWNIGDKAYRRFQLGEDWDSLGKAFLIEAVIDVVCFKLAFKANTVTYVSGQAAKQTGTEAVKVTKTVVEGFWTRWFSRDAVSRVLKNPLIAHSERLAIDAPKYIKEGVAKYAEKAATKASEHAMKKAAEAGVKDAADLARVGAEVVEHMSKWVEVSAKQRGLFITFPWSSKDPASQHPKGPVEGGDEAKKKIVQPQAGSVGPTNPKVSDSDYTDVAPVKKNTQPTSPTPSQPSSSEKPNPVIVGLTLEELMAAAALATPKAQPATPSPATPAAQSQGDNNQSPPQPTTSLASGPANAGDKPSGEGKGPSTGPQSPPSTGDTPPGGKPPGDPANPGPTGDGAGRAIAVAPPTVTGPVIVGPMQNGGAPAVNPTGATQGANAGTATQGATPGLQPVANPTPNAQVNPVANPVGNPTQNAQGSAVGNSTAQGAANPNPTLNANPVPQAVPGINPLAQPTSMELSLDTLMTAMARPAVQAAVMNDAVKQVEAEVSKAAVAEERRSIPNPQAVAANKKTDDGEMLNVLHKREAIAMKESKTREKEAVVAEVAEKDREKATTKSEHTAKIEAVKIEETVREVARVSDAREANRVEGVALKESHQRDAERAAERQREVQTENRAVSSKGEVRNEGAMQTVAGGHESAPSTPQATTTTFAHVAPVAVAYRAVPDAQSKNELPNYEEPPTAHLSRATLDSGTTARHEAVRSSEQGNSTAAPTASHWNTTSSSVVSSAATEQATAIKGEASAPVAASFVAPRPMAVPVTSASSVAPSNTDSGSSSDSSGGAPAPKGVRKPRTAKDDSRMRQVILQQLMSQHATKAQREKLLKALVALGISEVEYRKLVAKLGEMDAMRLAQQQADRRKFAEPVAIANEAPELKEDVAPLKEASAPTPAPKSQTTRAQLYQRLKEEASTGRKRAS